MAAMFSNMTISSRCFSFLIPLKISIVRGTKVTKDTSLVIKGARKNTTATRNKDKPLIVLNLSVSLKKG